MRPGLVPSGRRRISGVVLISVVAVSAENVAPVRGAGEDCVMKNAAARGFSNQDSSKTVAMMSSDHGGRRGISGDIYEQ